MAIKTQASPEEVLTLHEAAALLKVSEKTLWQQARAGVVPSFRVGKQFRFVWRELLEWASKSPSSEQD